ncbi:MAG: bile acid:sodium symporter family protein [Bacteroidota bacterium]
MTSTITKVSGLLAIVFLIVTMVLWFTSGIESIGPYAIALLLFAGLYMQGSENLSGFTYTVMILAAVTASLFYPQPFRELFGYDLKQLIVPLLMIIMFGVGTAMGWRDFQGIAKMPKGVLVGLICQFTIMPFIGFGLAKASGLPPEIAAGIILVGCSPSGLASNVMAYISGANLALSITLTTVATLLAPILTPFYMKVLADELVPIDFFGMLWSIVKIVIIPIIAGLIFNQLAHGKFKWLDKVMPRISMISIGVIITIITAAGRDSLLSIGLILIGVVIIHNGLGFFLGYWGGRLAGLDEKSSRTVAFEVGMQNGGLASGIALEMGRVATMGLAPAVFGPWMNISGSSLATWWKSKSEKKEDRTAVD